VINEDPFRGDALFCFIGKGARQAEEFILEQERLVSFGNKVIEGKERFLTGRVGAKRPW